MCRFGFVPDGIQSFSWIEDGFEGTCSTEVGVTMELNYVPAALPPGPGWDCCTYTYVETDGVESHVGQVLMELNNPGAVPPVPDFDGDGFHDLCDNCLWYANPLQEDSDGNGVGNACPEPTMGTGLAIASLWLSMIVGRSRRSGAIRV